MAVYRKVKPWRYRTNLVVGELGSGLSGKVYLAQREPDGAPVALKLLHGSADQLVRDFFLNEQRLLRKARHPNIVRYVEGGSNDEEGFLVTQFVEGTRLDELLGSPLPAAAAGYVVEQLAGALDYLHERHPDHPIIHCDVTPRNIVVEEDGQVMLLDLSSARTSFFAPAEDASMLSPRYCAPEQFQHNPFTHSDQYALAVIAFELLTGKPLFPKASRRERHQPDDPIAFAGMPARVPGVREVLERALSHHPEARYASCGAFAAQLERALRQDGALDGDGRAALVDFMAARAYSRRRTGRRQFAAFGALLLVSVAGLVAGGRLPSVASGATIAALSAPVSAPPTATLARVTPLASRPGGIVPTATLGRAILPVARVTETPVASALASHSPMTVELAPSPVPVSPTTMGKPAPRVGAPKSAPAKLGATPRPAQVAQVPPAIRPPAIAAVQPARPVAPPAPTARPAAPPQVRQGPPPVRPAAPPPPPAPTARPVVVAPPPPPPPVRPARPASPPPVRPAPRPPAPTARPAPPPPARPAPPPPPIVRPVAPRPAQVAQAPAPVPPRPPKPAPTARPAPRPAPPPTARPAPRPTPRPAPRPTARPAARKPTPRPRPAPRRTPAPAGITMPNVLGLGENQAKDLLQRNGVSAGQIVVQYQSRSILGPLFDRYPAYAVVSSLPPAGSVVKPGALVILGVRSPEDDVPRNDAPHIDVPRIDLPLPRPRSNVLP